ncbi:MAG: glycosyltransferase family 4 protein [Bacteroidota bacterium]
MILDTPYPPDARVRNEIRTLQQAGISVDLFTIEFDLSGESSGWTGSRLERTEYEGVRIWRWHAGRLWYKLSALVHSIPLFSRWVAPRIRDFLHASRPDLIHIHDMVIAPAALREAKRHSIPTILDLHEDRPLILPHYPHMRSRWVRRLIRPRRWAIAQRQLMKAADRVILVTDEAKVVAQERDRIPPEKITVLPNVVWPGEFDFENGYKDDDESARTRPVRLLYIGDTSLRRGTGTILEAVKLLADGGCPVELVMVGNSSMHNRLVTMAKTMRIHDRIQWTGWVPYEALPEQVAEADIGLLPLLRNGHHDTTYANKLFQYMAGGLPVIVSDCPAQEKLVRDEGCGRVHRAGDVGSLAEQIQWMVDHPDERHVMGRRGREAVQLRWNWSVTGRRLMALYESLQPHTNEGLSIEEGGEHRAYGPDSSTSPVE